MKTFKQFDFSFQRSIDRKVVRELASLGFLKRAENVIVLGPPGVDKSHLTTTLGVKTAEGSHPLLFLTLEQIMAKLKRVQQENRLEMQLE